MGYTLSQANAFIERIAPLMILEAQKRGYKVVSTAIAQAIIEGAAGTSKLAKPPYNNHWGLKCGKAWLDAKKPSVNMKTKEEYIPGKLTTINDYFRAFPNGDAEAVKGYYDFISAKRYANLKTAVTYKQYAEFLKADGYATSNSYISTLSNTVVKYCLQKYDSMLVGIIPPANDIDSLAHEVINGLWGSGTTRMLRLTSAGYDYNAIQKRVNEILKGK